MASSFDQSEFMRKRRRAAAAWTIYEPGQMWAVLPIMAATAIIFPLLALKFITPNECEDPAINLIQSKAAVETLRPMVPADLRPEDDAAIDYKAAFKSYTDYVFSPGSSLTIHILDGPSRHFTSPEAVSFVESNTETLEHIKTAVSKTEFKIDEEIREHEIFSGLVDVLKVLARQAAAQGDHKRAVLALETLTRLGQHHQNLYQSFQNFSNEVQRLVEGILLWDTPKTEESARLYLPFVQSRDIDALYVQELKRTKIVELFEWDSAMTKNPQYISQVQYTTERRSFVSVMDILIERTTARQYVDSNEMLKIWKSAAAGPTPILYSELQGCAWNGYRRRSICEKEDRKRLTQAALAYVIFKLRNHRPPTGWEEIPSDILAEAPKTVAGKPPMVKLGAITTGAFYRAYSAEDIEDWKNLGTVLRIYSVRPNGTDNSGLWHNDRVLLPGSVQSTGSP